MNKKNKKKNAPEKELNCFQAVWGIFVQTLTVPFPHRNDGFKKSTSFHNACSWNSKFQFIPSIPYADFGILEHCNAMYELESKSIEVLQQKAEWVLALLAGVLGIMLLKGGDAASGDPIEVTLRISAAVCAIPVCLLCLRCRLPAELPTPITPQDSIDGINEINSEFPRNENDIHRHAWVLMASKTAAVATGAICVMRCDNGRKRSM